ncbi:MAG TPA: CerR family C-terminal domain-containing protein [Blastocatellia bacterium]|nr:CerR family C-terminal domain-containing protein [Blastocatellia bacterium]
MSREAIRSGGHGSKPASQPIAADRTRAKLLDAAGEVFAEVGYYDATVRQICARAGANVAAVNYHFRDKLGLYTEVLRQTVGAVQNEAIRKALDDDAAPEEKLRHAIRAMFQKMCGADRPDLRFGLMAHELAHPTPALSRVIDEAIRPIYRSLREIIGTILNLPPDNATTRLCTISVVGQIVHYAHARPVLTLLWPALKMTPAQVTQIANHIADFSLAYIQTAAGSAGDAATSPRDSSRRQRTRRGGNDRPTKKRTRPRTK